MLANNIEEADTAHVKLKSCSKVMLNFYNDMHWGLSCFAPRPRISTFFSFAMAALPLWSPPPPQFPRALTSLRSFLLLPSAQASVPPPVFCPPFYASFQFIVPKLLWRPFRRLCSLSARPDGSVVQWLLIPWWRLSLPARLLIFTMLVWCTTFLFCISSWCILTGQHTLHENSVLTAPRG